MRAEKTERLIGIYPQNAHRATPQTDYMPTEKKITAVGLLDTEPIATLREISAG